MSHASRAASVQYTYLDTLDICNRNFRQAKHEEHDENTPKFLSSDEMGSCKKTNFQLNPFSKKFIFVLKFRTLFEDQK